MPEIDKIVSIFFNVLKDLKEYLSDLVLVGGWTPYVYSRFLWGIPLAKLITTVDIDFGFGDAKSSFYQKTIFEILSTLDYTERHPKMDRIYPVVFYKDGKIPVDFITFPEVSNEIIEKFIGRQISINKIGKFEFLLKHRIPINIVDKRQNIDLTINCPKSSAFLYHKGAAFIDRENKEKQAKDLHYMYFVLRYVPNINIILNEIEQYKEEGYFENIAENLNGYFERISSRGCLMVEKENGPDEYIENLRQDIFDRFKLLRGIL